MKQWQDYALPDNALFPDQYTVLEVLRDTNPNCVLLGTDEKENCKVIIKSFKQSAKGAYLREISAVYDLKHPQLVRCLNTFHRSDGESCLVYEYYAGGTLATLLEAKGILSDELIFDFLHDILQALIYFHAQNRIHCDIKPENIFLRPKANGYGYILGDFGAACFLREAQEGQHVVGTPAYIAPERIRNQFYFNSDLYSVGVVAYELATGTRPFTGTVEQITNANLNEIPSLEEIKNPALRDLIDNLLIKSPQKRMESASKAFFYLNKIRKQFSKAQESNPGFNLNQINLPKVSEADGKQPVLRQFNLVSLDENFKGLHSFMSGKTMLLGFEYPGRTDIIDPNFPDAVQKTIMSNSPLLISGGSSFIYATPSRVQSFNIENQRATLIKEKINGIKHFDFYDNKLLIADDFNINFYDLSSGGEFSFRKPSYIFDAKLQLSENGNFYMSEGMANEKVVLRDSKGNIVNEWVLDGPLTAMERLNNKMIAFTLNVEAQNNYSIWCLGEGKNAIKCELPHNIKQIMVSKKAVYWLTQDHELYNCDISLQYKIIGQYSENTISLAVSYDDRCIVIMNAVERNRAFVTIHNNRE